MSFVNPNLDTQGERDEQKTKLVAETRQEKEK
jgi:hypothetical protein